MANIAALFTIMDVALSVDKACDMFQDVTPKLQPRAHGTFPLKENENLHLQFSISKTEECWHFQKTAAIFMDSLNVKKGFKKSEKRCLNGMQLHAGAACNAARRRHKRFRHRLYGVMSSAVPAQGRALAGAALRWALCGAFLQHFLQDL